MRAGLDEHVYSVMGQNTYAAQVPTKPIQSSTKEATQ